MRDQGLGIGYAGFLYAEFEEGKPVEVLRVGEFVDRNGKDVVITSGDLDEFVANFEAGKAGQEVPIDIQHERSEAGGWVRRLWREGERLLASVEWNELGTRLVGEKIYRYLSATIDLPQKLVKAISLVNFPAVKGLAPVELAEGVYRLEVERGLVRRIVEEVVEKVLGIRDWVLSEGLVEFVIRKEGNEIVLYSADGEKVLGRFPFGEGEKYADEEAARAAAEKREKEIQYFKHREGGEGIEGLTELQGNVKNIVASWRKWAGSHTACVRALRGKPGISNPEALCAWLHKEAEGKWPAEGSEYEPGLAELKAMVDAVTAIIAELDQEGRMDEKQEQELREQIRAEMEAELAEKEQALTELREQVRGEVEAELQERFERKQKLVEFAEEVCGGEAGLSVKPDELVEALEAIPTEAQPKVMEMLKAKVVDFTEHGSSAPGKEAKKKLPAEMEGHLKEFVDNGGTVAEFFEANADVLGEKDQYDLEEYEE